MSNWTVNGTSEPTLPIDDRATQYGDGLFETVAIRRGEARFWDLHVERLVNGCDRLGLTRPSPAQLDDDLTAAIERSGVDSAYAVAKIMVSAGTGPRGYRRPEKQKTTVIIGVFVSRPWPVEAYRDGIVTRVCETRLACQPQLAGIKSLNRLEQVIAQSEWRSSDIAEGLMQDTADRLICGTMSNVFLVIDESIVTPAITRCGVSGIMRRKTIELLDAAGARVEVRDVDVNELGNAQGVFLSNSQFGLLPVRRCGRYNWKMHPLTRDIMNRIAAAGVPECRL